MKELFTTIVAINLFYYCNCTPVKVNTTEAGNNDKPMAFPGAEGFGKYTTGGRGGNVYIVTNLNDNGSGSFRQAVNAKAPRMIVFAVSGTIHLESPLSIKANTTIAGQTAPGDGICLADYPVSLGGDNIIIRYMRFRMGDRYQNKGMINGAGGDDAFGGTRRKNIIIDHCSMSWSTDEVFSVYAGDSTTLQWNIISEPLNYSYHFETGDKDFEHHGYGGIWGGRHLSAHHNLFAHCNSRTPRFDGIRNIPEENVDFRNNVIYNWGGNNVYAGEGGTYNIINNYYKYGSSTSEKVKFQVVNPWNRKPDIPYGKYFVAGNYIDGAPDVTNNNWLGVRVGSNGNEDIQQVKSSTPLHTISIPEQSAAEAYQAVLQSAGASFRRDTLDQRIINNVKNRTGRIIDVQGGYAHGTPYEQTKNAWPALKSLPAPKDSDGDGMPDDWEKKNGLNP
ncbi:MAG: pectate lyase, partial [Flavisolibacter sp.]|nr:pectate lyase [Flavisolibacter sp.]